MAQRFGSQWGVFLYAILRRQRMIDYVFYVNAPSRMDELMVVDVRNGERDISHCFPTDSCLHVGDRLLSSPRQLWWSHHVMWVSTIVDVRETLHM